MEAAERAELDTLHAAAVDGVLESKYTEGYPDGTTVTHGGATSVEVDGLLQKWFAIMDGSPNDWLWDESERAPDPAWEKHAAFYQTFASFEAVRDHVQNKYMLRYGIHIL
jgi:hypothetical protein